MRCSEIRPLGANAPERMSTGPSVLKRSQKSRLSRRLAQFDEPRRLANVLVSLSGSGLEGLVKASERRSPYG
jgi:hypothetical protein